MGKNFLQLKGLVIKIFTVTVLLALLISMSNLANASPDISGDWSGVSSCSSSLNYGTELALTKKGVGFTGLAKDNYGKKPVEISPKKENKFAIKVKNRTMGRSATYYEPDYLPPLIIVSEGQWCNFSVLFRYQLDKEMSQPIRQYKSFDKFCKSATAWLDSASEERRSAIYLNKIRYNFSPEEVSLKALFSKTSFSDFLGVDVVSMTQSDFNVLDKWLSACILTEIVSVKAIYKEGPIDKFLSGFKKGRFHFNELSVKRQAYYEQLVNNPISLAGFETADPFTDWQQLVTGDDAKDLKALENYLVEKKAQIRNERPSTVHASNQLIDGVVYQARRRVEREEERQRLITEQNSPAYKLAEQLRPQIVRAYFGNRCQILAGVGSVLRLARGQSFTLFDWKLSDRGGCSSYLLSNKQVTFVVGDVKVSQCSQGVCEVSYSIDCFAFSGIGNTACVDTRQSRNDIRAVAKVDGTNIRLQ